MLVRGPRLTVPQLKEGHRMSRMQRLGPGKEPIYIPIEVAANSTTTKTTISASTLNYIKNHLTEPLLV